MSPAPATDKRTKHTRSTGPRSKAGKATSSQNALRHGLASGTLLIPGEDRRQWEALLASLHEEWAPATPTERLLVEDLARHHWLKERALRLQSQALSGAAANSGLPPDFALLLRYQTTNERAFARALRALQVLQKQRQEFVSQKANEVAAAQHAKVMARLASPFPPFDPQAALERYRAQTARQSPNPARAEISLPTPPAVSPK